MPDCYIIENDFQVHVDTYPSVPDNQPRSK